MKIKTLLVISMSILILLLGFNQIQAYSPDFLPGGKNYLSSDNFHVEGDDYETINPFLVKSYTEYTLTIPRLYEDIPWDNIVINYYIDGSWVDDFIIEPNNFIFYDDGDDQWYYYTFTTYSEVNYLGIEFDNFGDYFTTEGFYGFQLEEGNQFTGYEAYIEGTIIDTTAPYFQSSGLVISYVDSPITVSEIQSGLTAYDEVDGDLSSEIVLVSDGYTSNNDTLGSYNVVFEVSDTSGNTTQITINVEVVDVLKPVFSDIGTIQAVYPNTYTTTDILNMLSASDNYDGDISSQIVLVNDNYTANASVVGIYEMEFSVTDSSGNTANYIQEIEVVDNEGPIISGTTSIVIGYDSIITPDDVASNLDFNDNYDDKESLDLVLVSDDYTEHSNFLGNYTMVFSVTDSSNNETLQTVNIQVVDEIGPVVYFDLSVVQTYTDTVMQLPDFTQLLLNSNELKRDDNYYVTIRYDSYSKNATVPGTYHLTLDYKNDAEEVITKNFEIKVIERPIDYIQQAIPIEDNQETFLQKYKEYLIGGSLSLLLLSSNVIWVILFKKKG